MGEDLSDLDGGDAVSTIAPSWSLRVIAMCVIGVVGVAPCQELPASVRQPLGRHTQVGGRGYVSAPRIIPGAEWVTPLR